MKKQTPMKRLSEVIKSLEAVLCSYFDFSQKNKKAGSPIPYDVRTKFNLEHEATTGGIPFDTMYFFRDVQTPYVKAPGKYMPQPGKSIALGFEYNQVDEPLITASTVIVDFDHSKTVKASLPLGVAEMRTRLKAFVEEMKFLKNASVDMILILFEQMVIVTTVEDSYQGQEEIAKIKCLLEPKEQSLSRLRVERDEICESIATAHAKAEEEVAAFISQSGIDERIRKLEGELDLMKKKRASKIVEVAGKYNLDSLERKKQMSEGKILKLNREIKRVIGREVESMPIAIKQAVESHFEK